MWLHYVYIESKLDIPGILMAMIMFSCIHHTVSKFPYFWQTWDSYQMLGGYCLYHKYNCTVVKLCGN